MNSQAKTIAEEILDDMKSNVELRVTAIDSVGKHDAILLYRDMEDGYGLVMLVPEIDDMDDGEVPALCIAKEKKDIDDGSIVFDLDDAPPFFNFTG